MSPEEALEKAVAAIRQHLDELLREQGVPSQLFHYTTSAGLVGILTSKKFFATDILAMRDQSEFRYGAGVVHQAIRDLHAGEANSITESLLRPFEEDPMLGLGSGVFFHAVCFCEKDDVLTQWQMFSEAGGFALGIDFQNLLGRQMAGEFILAKMLYDPTRQRDLVDSVVLNGLAVFRHYEESLRRSHESLNGLIYELGVTLYNLISRFKHPCFSTEAEWRVLIADEGDVKFRSAGSGVVPYREIDVQADAFSHIIRSPGRWPPNDCYAVNRLARSLGEHVRVESSRLPFL